MATKPRTFQQAQAVYRGSSAELRWWVFMRVSGLLLIFLTFGHLFFNNIQIDAATIDYAFVAERLSKPWVRIYDTFLLAFAMLHGMNGLRYSIEDYVRRPGPRFWWKVVLYSLTAIVFVAGVMTLWAFSYEEMGAAVRAID